MIDTYRSTEKHRPPSVTHGDPAYELGDSSEVVDRGADDVKPKDDETITTDIEIKVSDERTIRADEDLGGASVEM